MNRVLPIMLIAGAIFFHFAYCEWKICNHEKIANQSRMGRTIYYSYEKAGRYDVFLLSKTADSLEDAKLYGLLLPLALLGGALVIPKLTTNTNYYSSSPRVEA
jgi:hypothetical protein